eukprot:7745696-Alexandrium_andersonii.AAC.1
MSASLVGSEMCIRDSSWRGGLAGVSPLRPNACEANPRPLGKVALSREAVSYTHLTLPTICSV